MIRSKRAQQKHPAEYKKLRLKTLVIATLAATVLAASAAAFAVSLTGFVWGGVAVLAATPFLFIALGLLIKKIDDKTHFWSSKVAEITVLQQSIKKQTLIFSEKEPANIFALIKRAAASCQLSLHGHPNELYKAQNDINKVLSIGEKNLPPKELLQTQMALGELNRLHGKNAESLFLGNKERTNPIASLFSNQRAIAYYKKSLSILDELLKKEPDKLFCAHHSRRGIPRIKEK